MEPVFNITSEAVTAKPRQLKTEWTSEAIRDFRDSFGGNWKEIWVKKVSKPGYELTPNDKRIAKEMLGYD